MRFSEQPVGSRFCQLYKELGYADDEITLEEIEGDIEMVESGLVDLSDSGDDVEKLEELKSIIIADLKGN